MKAPRVQFLTFDGCPLAVAAKIELEAALAACDIASYEEIDVLDPATPANLRGWGSPTILIDGVDVAGQHKGDDACCRIYAGERGVPGRAEIIGKIRARKR